MKVPMSCHFMPGDYIKTTTAGHTNKIYQISTITQVKVGVHASNQNKIMYIRNNDIHFIPITEKFLILNNFEIKTNDVQFTTYVRYYKFDNYNACVKINKSNDNSFNVNVSTNIDNFIHKRGVKYVHDFQHILRMVDFSLEANNLVFPENN